jgi:uncharacterized protein YkwD
MGTFRPQMLAAGAAILTALSLTGCQASPIPVEVDGPVSQGTPVVAAKPEPKAEAKSDPDVAERVAAVVEAHNRERKKSGLPPLNASAKLQAAAMAHARDMAEHERMNHKGTDGSTPFRRIERQGYSYRRAGENIAYGQPDAEGVMKVWMNSPPHKKNILGGFSQIGVGYATAEDGTPYWCVTFGFPLRP